MSNANTKPASSPSSAAADPTADLQDELRPEYDLDQLNIRGVGTYFKEAVANYGYVHIDEDVREIFPDEQAVNEALRTMIRLSPAIRALLERSDKPSLAPANISAKAG